MAETHTADIVLSLTGRDKGLLMLVVAEEGDFLLLANGRGASGGKPEAQAPPACQPPGPVR